MGRLTRDSGKGPRWAGPLGLRSLRYVVNVESRVVLRPACSQPGRLGAPVLAEVAGICGFFQGGHAGCMLGIPFPSLQSITRATGQIRGENRTQCTFFPLLTPKNQSCLNCTRHPQHQSTAGRAHWNRVALCGEAQCSPSGLRERVSIDTK